MYAISLIWPYSPIGNGTVLVFVLVRVIIMIFKGRKTRVLSCTRTHQRQACILLRRDCILYTLLQYNNRCSGGGREPNYEKIHFLFYPLYYTYVAIIFSSSQQYRQLPHVIIDESTDTKYYHAFMRFTGNSFFFQFFYLRTVHKRTYNTRQRLWIIITLYEYSSNRNEIRP